MSLCGFLGFNTACCQPSVWKALAFLFLTFVHHRARCTMSPRCSPLPSPRKGALGG